MIKVSHELLVLQFPTPSAVTTGMHYSAWLVGALSVGFDKHTMESIHPFKNVIQRASMISGITTERLW